MKFSTSAKKTNQKNISKQTIPSQTKVPIPLNPLPTLLYSAWLITSPNLACKLGDMRSLAVAQSYGRGSRIRCGGRRGLGGFRWRAAAVNLFLDPVVHHVLEYHAGEFGPDGCR